MKKKIKLLCILFIMVICLNMTACGEDTTSSSVESSGNTINGILNENYDLEDTSMGYNYESAVPKAAIQAKIIYQISNPERFSDKLTLATLQGLVANFSNEQIIINYGTFGNIRTYMQDVWGCITPTNVNGTPISISSLLEKYKDSLSGYILCEDNENSDSGNVAISLAGVLNAVVVTPENVEICKEFGMDCVLDVRKKDDAWLRSSEYWSQLSTDVAVEQPLNMAPKLVDYAVMSKAYFSFYNGTDSSEHHEKYDYLSDGGIVFGYNNTLGELDTVDSLSKINLQLIPSDHALNLSTLSGFEASSFEQKYLSVGLDTSSNKHTVCIVMSDGDNVQWLLNDFTTSDYWYNNSNRGSFNMGWGIAPTAIDLIAPMQAYLYDNMTEKDEFIAQLSGLGYTFPSRWTASERQSMAAKLSEYMSRSGIKYAEILDDNGMTAESISDFTSQSSIQGLFYIDYADYAGKKGQILWTNNKPTVSAKYRLWANTPDGTVENIASSVNSASTDPISADSYSFIIVHAWSGLSDDSFVAGGNTMDAVKKLVESFDENVEVVTPSVFMDRIITNKAK